MINNKSPLTQPSPRRGEGFEHQLCRPLSPMGRGRGPLSSDSGRVRGRLLQLDQYHLKNAVRVGKHIRVPEANDTIAPSLKETGAPHIGGIARMLPAIGLDNEHTISAKKIRDIGPNRRLSSEFETAERPITQPRPETRFRLGLHDAQMPRTGHILSFQTTPPSPFPLPEGAREINPHYNARAGNR